ncbi:MAG: PEP-CTERM sorting domain-containing protein [Fimbriimonadaceae bacterium]|nr:PEP-CTERM sorting domain-containing protein [Fimbriimonadaceae bacterium]QYK57447.1 MAG: PEP-CTERM sorting domain-containing protein [Fimbriimonadaceae bacterium]
MKKLLSLALIVASTASFAQLGANWTGSLTVTDPTYNRTFQDGSGLSGIGSSVFYDVQLFWVTGTGQYTYEIVGDDEDTFAFIYTNFNPATPLAGFVGGGDDWLDFKTSKIGEGQGTPTNLVLTANVQYYAITTSFANGETFNYRNEIRPLQGTVGDVKLGVVPEPGTMLALGAGLAAVAARRRRK